MTCEMEGDCNCARSPFHMLKFSNLKMFGGTVYRAEGKERANEHRRKRI